MADFLNVISQSYAGKDCLTISLCENTGSDYKDYMPRYIVFMTMAPGTTGGQRGYDFSKKVTLKTDLIKLMAFAKSLQMSSQYIVDKEQFIIENNKFNDAPTVFNIFSDPSKTSYNSGGGLKILRTAIFKTKDNKCNIALSVKEGEGKAMGLSWPPAEAMSIGMSMERIASLGMEMDFKYKKDHPYQGGNNNRDDNRSSRPSSPSGSDAFGGDFGPPPAEDDMPF